MSISRRDFVGLTTGALAVAVLGSHSFVRAAENTSIRCLAFDAFAILDPRPIGVLTEHLFPGNGGELLKTWRTRQFEYTWLRSMSGRYADFLKVTEDSLVFAARGLKLELTDARRRQLLHAFLELKAYPDVRPALTTLRAGGLRLALLSNFTMDMLQAGIRNSNLDGCFEHVLSTDAVKLFKPAPAAYQMAIDAFRVRREEIAFVPFAGWDAAGAKSFGYRTFWMNRQNQPPENLDASEDGMGEDMASLLKFLGIESAAPARAASH